MMCDNDITNEVKNCIPAANKAKFALFTNLILPVVLYGHETKSLKEAFGVFKRKVLRTMLGGK